MPPKRKKPLDRQAGLKSARLSSTTPPDVTRNSHRTHFPIASATAKQQQAQTRLARCRGRKAAVDVNAASEAAQARRSSLRAATCSDRVTPTHADIVQAPSASGWVATQLL